jgi:asparagine synthase (glutamine-hydrolysing)
MLDHVLVEYCLRHGAAGAGSKRALLGATSDLLPAAQAFRPKQGFVLPLGNWMRGPLEPFVRQGLQAVASHGSLTKLNVEMLLKHFQRGRVKYSRVWQFAVLGWWLQQNGLEAAEPLNIAANA